MKKYLCALLAGLMLLAAFAGCANLDNDGETETAATLEGETDEAALALSELSVDWGKEEFVIIGRNDHTPAELKVDDESDTHSEVLETAVYQRNLAFEELCKLTLNVVQEETNKVTESVKTDVKTGAGEYDLVHQHMAQTANLASEGNLISYTALDGIDLSAPWWDQGTASFMISDKVYFMNSAINYSDENTTYVMLFNKQMAEDEKIDPYQLVYDNQWTLDKFQTLIKEVSYDLTGEGKYDENDVYGFVATWETGNTFFFGSDLRYVVCEEGEDPYLALDSTGMNKASDLLDKVLNIYYVNNSTYASPAGKENLGMDCFKAGRGLFYGEVVQYIVHLGKEMATDFGVLPIPKYNESQKDYITWTNGICSTTSITKACQHLDKIGPTLEILAILSYQRVTPAFYDTVLQRKSVRDEESQGMLDIIFKTRTYDLSMYYDLGLEPLFKAAVNDNKTNFTSTYGKQEKKAEKKLGTLVEKFAKEE